MTSTFHGLEVSRRSLFTQQTAIQTMGHNIANANTEGYSRQRVNMQSALSIEAYGMTHSTIPGQLGMGVEFSSITRIRDSFLDEQYRRENQTLGALEVQQSNMASIEALINEPSENGISGAMDRFWDAWEALNRDPSLLSSRVDVLGEAQTLVETLQYTGASLTQYESDMDSNIEIKVEEANNIIANIAGLNEQIRKLEGLGDDANDLRDSRDLLVDQLSSIVNITVSETTDGDYIVEAAGVEVVNGSDYDTLTTADAENATAGNLYGYVQAKEDIASIRDQLNAMVQTLVTGEVEITLPEGYVTATDLIAEEDVQLTDGTVIAAGMTIPSGSEIGEGGITLVVDGFNGLHELGYGLDSPATGGIPFFTTTDGGTFTIDNIQVNPSIAENTNLIAASGNYETDSSGVNVPIKGNSDIAHALAGLRDETFTFPSDLTSLSTGTTDDFFRAVVSELGVNMSNLNREVESQEEIVNYVDSKRASVSGVSLDEEMADMIKFQQAYNAAARSMTAIDEMLDKVINGMGIVGR